MLSHLDFQSTACGKSQYFISGSKSMGNHVQHFACVSPYELNYLCVLWIPQSVTHSDGSAFLQF